MEPGIRMLSTIGAFIVVILVVTYLGPNRDGAFLDSVNAYPHPVTKTLLENYEVPFAEMCANIAFSKKAQKRDRQTRNPTALTQLRFPRKNEKMLPALLRDVAQGNEASGAR